MKLQEDNTVCMAESVEVQLCNSSQSPSNDLEDGHSDNITLGQLFVEIGTLKYVKANGQIRLCINSDAGTALENAKKIVLELSEDFQPGKQIPAVVRGTYILSETDSSSDLDAIAEAISIQSGGSLLATHCCPCSTP